MKKILSITLFAGCIFGVVACQKEALDQNSEVPTGKTVRMILNATQDDATKTVLDGTTAKWKESDKVTVMYEKNSGSGWYTQESGAASSSDSYATASFTVDLTDPNTGKNAYAIYPANNLTQSVSDKAKITIAATQHPTMTSFDGASDILISKPFTPSGSVTTQFSRPGAILKIKINNATLSSEKLLSLSVTGANDLAGDVLVNLDGASVYGIENGSTTVTAEYESENQFTVGSGYFVYLIVKPQTLAAGSTLTVEGETENYTFSKNITIPAGGIHLNAGHIVPLRIDITSTTKKQGWYQIKNASWLYPGDRVVIVNNNGTRALKKEQSTYNRKEVEITVTGKKITSFDANVQEFILESGTVSGSFAFWCDNGDKINYYIYAAGSSGNNYLKSQTSLNGDASFVLTLTDGCYGYLTAQGTNTNKYLRYNSSNKLFSCYSSETSQQNISIYKFYGEYSASTFRFGTVSGLTALGIEPPAEAKDQTFLVEGTQYCSGNVTMTIVAGTGSNKTRIYNSGGTTRYLGVYTGSTNGALTFDAGTGKTITKIEFVPNGSNFGLTPSTGSFGEAPNDKIWTGSSQMVTFSASSANQIFAAKVYYE